MTLREFKELLATNSDQAVQLMLSDGSEVPVHFHVTEVGHVRKQFVDCGGTRRERETCQLQVWVASDIWHRIDTTKLSRILGLANDVFSNDDLEVEIEYEATVVSQYPIASWDLRNGAVVFNLGTNHTDCLAKESCGVPETAAAEDSCCSGSGCCG